MVDHFPLEGVAILLDQVLVLLIGAGAGAAVHREREDQKQKESGEFDRVHSEPR